MNRQLNTQTGGWSISTRWLVWAREKKAAAQSTEGLQSAQESVDVHAVKLTDGLPRTNELDAGLPSRWRWLRISAGVRNVPDSRSRSP